MKKVAILGIDLQYDFTSPQGSLYVQGAEQDLLNIDRFMVRKGAHIDYIALTLDSHQPIHISSQSYWKDVNGNHPPLFTVITTEDVVAGKWIPQYNVNLVFDYLKIIDEQGEKCTIWPAHCILGSRGWAIDENLINTLSKWCIHYNKTYELYYKGFHQATEHYSIFKAAVSYEDAPETQLNRNLLDKLNTFDEIIIVGEAADYCVASSLNDILEEAPEIVPKLVVFTDCMSWIVDCNEKGTKVFDKAKQLGVRFIASTEY